MTAKAHSIRPWRRRLAEFIEHPRTQFFVMTLILVNAAILGLETSATAMRNWGTLLVRLDQLILGVFVVEILLRFVAHGWRLLRDPWGLFDTTVIAIALIPATGPCCARCAFCGCCAWCLSYRA
jgi:voltage-gated sodium channel